MSVPTFAFTLLRNAIKYDYCYLESLKSLEKNVSLIFLAMGRSEDGTEQTLSEIKKLKVISTVWDEALREGAIILSQQTNVALNDCREYCQEKGEIGAWAIYLQADEVLHQEDTELLKNDIEKAEMEGADAISFRYFHFWQTHHHIAINKKWYPHEIRAIKLFPRTIESWGDAQSFKNVKKVFYSEVRVFHYGHVRDAHKYHEKKKDILELYHPKNLLKKYQKREKKFDQQTEVLAYWGSHPQIMKNRILKMGESDEASTIDEIFIVGNEKDYPRSFLNKINVRKIHWINSSWRQFFSKDCVVIPRPNFWQRLLFPSNVPFKMRSKLARDWNPETLLMLKLSEKGIGVSS